MIDEETKAAMARVRQQVSERANRYTKLLLTIDSELADAESYLRRGEARPARECIARVRGGIGIAVS